MAELSERLNTPISTAELERRWSAVRAAMQTQKIDVLLMQNNNDYMGGYVKYFTDTPATNGYPQTVVFPRDTGITVVMQGPFGNVQTLPADGNALWRGVKTIMTTPSGSETAAPATKEPGRRSLAAPARTSRPAPANVRKMRSNSTTTAPMSWRRCCCPSCVG